MEKASSESTPPSQFSALCKQQGPAVALCPVVNLSVVSILSYTLHQQTESVMPLSVIVVKRTDGKENGSAREW